MKQPSSGLIKDQDILSRSEVFSGIPFEVIQFFAYFAKRKQFLAGELIIEMEREANHACILIKGEVDITLLHHDRELTLQTLGEGTFFGELALLARFNWFFNARAKSDCEVIILDRESFQHVLDKFPAHRERMIERIVQLRVKRLTDQNTHMLDALIKASSGDCSTGTSPIT
ncbi:MAG: cyclic nucleotide-binding domain-containing protein [Thermodesulfobacteriota bacterium]